MFSEALIELRSGGPFAKLSFSTYLVTKPSSFIKSSDSIFLHNQIQKLGFDSTLLKYKSIIEINN
ncbi:hypothetical protein Hanom_Chr13g01187791 [Helianthus anomalus]